MSAVVGSCELRELRSGHAAAPMWGNTAHGHDGKLHVSCCAADEHLRCVWKIWIPSAGHVLLDCHNRPYEQLPPCSSKSSRTASVLAIARLHANHDFYSVGIGHTGSSSASEMSAEGTQEESRCDVIPMEVDRSLKAGPLLWDQRNKVWWKSDHARRLSFEDFDLTLSTKVWGLQKVANNAVGASQLSNTIEVVWCQSRQSAVHCSSQPYDVLLAAEDGRHRPACW
jgi:hypothetical protein